MMRVISFLHTADQIRNQTKTVTRRIGWVRLTPGTLLQPVVKAQGLRKGEHVEPIGGPICVVSVRRELLRDMTADECAREGFPELTPAQFAEMFSRIHHGRARFVTDAPDDEVTRIEFSFLTAPDELRADDARDPVDASVTGVPRA